MIKRRSGGKKGVKLMPNHFDYLSERGGFHHVSKTYNILKNGKIMASAGVTYDPFNKIQRRRNRSQPET